MAVALEHMVRELRDEVRELTKLRSAVEALVAVNSELRDALIMNTRAMQDLGAAIDELRKGRR